jgi:hypothetical protein
MIFFRKFTPENEDSDGSSLTASAEDNSTKTYTVSSPGLIHNMQPSKI